MTLVGIVLVVDLINSRRLIMSVCTLNNSIKSYYEFFNQLCKHPGSSEIQIALAEVKKCYNNYKKDEEVISEIKEYLKNLNTESAYDILLSFTEPEEVWAYIHLMIETVEEKPLNLWSQIRSFSDMNAFQNGMSRLWSKGHKTVYTVML